MRRIALLRAVSSRYILGLYCSRGAREITLFGGLHGFGHRVQLETGHVQNRHNHRPANLILVECADKNAIDLVKEKPVQISAQKVRRNCVVAIKAVARRRSL